MKKLMKLKSGEDGQAFVLIALLMVVLMGFAALGVDVGSAYFTKERLQNAADAAALAGAKDLSNLTTAEDTAVLYAGKNGMKATVNNTAALGDKVSAKAGYGGDLNKIEVVCTRTVKYSFAGALGFKQTDVSARAVAQKTAGLPAEFGYAVFSGSKDKPLHVGKNNDTATGSIHTNNTLYIDGNNNIVTGACEGLTGVVVDKPSKNDLGSIKEKTGTTYIDMPTDFKDELLAKVTAAPIHLIGNQVLGGSKLDLSSSIYVEGNVIIQGNQLAGKGFIYATGNITIDGNGIDMASSTDAVFIYSEKNVTISGNNFTMTGIIYAPNGIIDIQKNNWQINGRIIGDSFSDNCLKNNFNITAGTVELGGLPTGTGSVKLIE